MGVGMRNDEIQMSRTRCTNHTLESMNKKKQGGGTHKNHKDQGKIREVCSNSWGGVCSGKG